MRYPKTSPNLQVENQDYTTPLNGGSQETTLLSDSSETTLLNQVTQTTEVRQGDSIAESSNATEAPEKKLPGTFTIEKELLWVHTEEVL